MEAGCRVVRGPDWKWGDQDGGEGHVGTIVIVGRPGSSSSPDKTVVVQWDSGTRTNYRCGYQEEFDLRVFDNGPIGTCHTNTSCNECKKKGIEGIRWECADCLNFNLCNLCYMSDKHSLNHAFTRVEAPGKPGVYVGKRLDKCKIQAKGIFPGAQVVRGPDWDWGNQDGGQGNIGQVVDVRGWENESFRSVACVLWKPKVTNVYRVGHKGKVDLMCVNDGFGGSYYKNHLPKLGQDPESLVIPSSSNQASNCTVDSGPFQIGDRVQVLLDMNSLRDAQIGHGGWSVKMEEVIGVIGTVHRITEQGDIKVQYPGFSSRWTFHPAALTKVDELHINDMVRVLNDKDLVKKLQVGHGEWTSEMTVALDKVGKVLKIYSDGDIRVDVAGHMWTFNPAVLKREQSSTAIPAGQQPHGQFTPLQNQTHSLQQHHGTTQLQVKQQSSQQLRQQHQQQQHQQQRQQQQRQQLVSPPEELRQSQREIDQSLRSLLEHLRINSSTDIGSMIVSEAGQGNLERLKELLRAHPDKVNISRSDKTALQIASHQGLTAIVKYLLQSGANPDLQDAEGDTALHYAAFGNRPDTAVVLLERDANCNGRNKNKCSPLHVAVNKGHTEVVRVLLSFNCDVNARDSYGDMALHDAIAKGFQEIVDVLVNACGVDLTVKNKRGFNCLHHAALKGNARAASLIAAKVPNLVNVVKEDGFSALHLAALNGHLNVVKCLLEADPHLDLNLRNDRCQTPLLLAVDKRQTAITQLLLQRGADVNAQDDVGDSPLHVVVTFHSLNFARSNAPRKELKASSPTFVITRMLMDHGADARLVNKHGKTPVQVCRDPKLRAIISRHTSSVKTLTPKKSQTHNSCSASPHHSSQSCSPSDVATETDVKCQICGMSADAKFDPCGHVIACMSCASMLNKCFRCRASIKSFSKMHEEGNGDQLQCMVCSDAQPSVIFEPCGHTIACSDCARRMKRCLKCKNLITGKICSDETIQFDPTEKDEKYLETLHNLLSLQTRVREIEDANTCAICLEKPRNMAFLCGHGTCVECAESLELCHMCRKPIHQKIKLFT